VTGDLQTQLKSIEAGFQSTIENLKKQETALEDSYLGSVRMLANLMEQVGVHAGSHAGRVENLVSSLGPKCGIEDLELRGLKVAALTHEIGQFGLPDRIRSQPPWELSETDRHAFERYPIIGAALLSQVPGSDSISKYVEYHTENFDGTGFPEGKKGKDISMGARIIRLADGLDTFMMYAQQDAVPATIAMDHVKNNRGSLYDPYLVDLALATPEWFSFEAPPQSVLEITGYELKAGMILAEDLYDSSGVFLGRKGITIHDHIISRLHNVIGASKVKVTMD
jgi:response regulator RpfG family c-di-GMP phosphodiesterase